MYSVLLSEMDKVFPKIEGELRKIVNKDMKVLILPWAFKEEINSNLLMNEYFKKGEKRYNKYVEPLLKLGIKQENIIIGNCYEDSKNRLKEYLQESDILLLPGGNPEMLYSKVVQDRELLYDIKYFKGIIIGESAGCCLQFKRYFITAKNNYYKYFAFYDGFGILDNSFYVDVHTSNNPLYLARLEKEAKKCKKEIYAIYDDGAIIYNRVNNRMNIVGNVLKISKNENKD